MGISGLLFELEVKAKAVGKGQLVLKISVTTTDYLCRHNVTCVTTSGTIHWRSVGVGGWEAGEAGEAGEALVESPCFPSCYETVSLILVCMVCLRRNF